MASLEISPHFGEEVNSRITNWIRSDPVQELLAEQDVDYASLRRLTLRTHEVLTLGWDALERVCRS